MQKLLSCVKELQRSYGDLAKAEKAGNADSAKMIDGIRTVILPVPNTPKTTVPTSMSETPYPWIGIMTGCAALAGWMFVKLKKDKRTR